MFIYIYVHSYIKNFFTEMLFLYYIFLAIIFSRRVVLATIKLDMF